LLNEVKDINPTSALSTGDTAVHYAAQGGQLKTLEILKDKGTDLDIVNNCGWSALTYGATDGQVRAMKKLKDLGADMNIRNTKYAGGMTTVMYGIAGNKIDSLQTLKECGADLDVQTADGITAVMFAVAADHKNENKNDFGYLEELVKDRNANLDLKMNKNGMTALMWAVQNNRVDAAKILLDNGANVNAVDDDGLTPLMFAMQGCHTESAGLLLKHEAKTKLKDKRGWTCDDWALNTWRVTFKRVEVNEVWEPKLRWDPLPTGAKVNRCDANGTRYMWELRNKLLQGGEFERIVEKEKNFGMMFASMVPKRIGKGQKGKLRPKNE